ASTLSRVQFTSDPSVLYTLDFSQNQVRPSRSTDAGVTWTSLPNDPTFGGAFAIFADPAGSGRLILSEYTVIYSSQDGGATWTTVFTTADSNLGVHIGGAFFDGL